MSIKKKTLFRLIVIYNINCDYCISVQFDVKKSTLATKTRKYPSKPKPLEQYCKNKIPKSIQVMYVSGKVFLNSPRQWQTTFCTFYNNMAQQ